MNVKQMMRQAQQMQERMQRELAELVVEASVGGGMVTVKMSGHKQLLGVHIEPDALEGKDTAMLQDLVLSAVNEAGRKVDEALQSKLGALGAGMPGLF
jgi:DNA-binding YbaB/EbfC family protein